MLNGVGRSALAGQLHRYSHHGGAKQQQRWLERWAPVIGLELHVKLQTATKLFSDARTEFEDAPNSNVAVFDAALPGTLPELNKKALDLALQTAIALNCNIAKQSRFDRKHYTYHDLPAGYQITQKYHPIAKDGKVLVEGPRHDPFEVNIEQVQLEQDTAKTSVDIDSGDHLIDLNRAGIPLVEIVSKPDMSSSAQAVAYVKAVQRILRCIGASDGDMDKGSLRIDVNVSAASLSAENSGSRCEIKNLNSTRFMAQAIDAEFKRQVELLDQNPAPTIESETRGFDPVGKTTFKLRSKEDTPDYRYMPDPELPPIILSQTYIDQLQRNLPELPADILRRLTNTYGLSSAVAHRLVRLGEDDENSSGTFAPAVAYFERAALTGDPNAVANWITQDVSANLTKADIPIRELDDRLPAESLGLLVAAVTRQTLTATVAKDILARGILDRADVASFVAENKQGSTKDSVMALVDKIIIANPKQAEQVKQGQDKVIMWLVGQAMRESKGRAKASELAAAFKRILQS